MLTVFLSRKIGTGDEQVPDIQLTFISGPNSFLRRLNREAREKTSTETLATLRFPTRSHSLSKAKVRNIRKLEEVLQESWEETCTAQIDQEGALIFQTDRENAQLFWATQHILQEVAQKAYLLGLKNGLKAKRKK